MWLPSCESKGSLGNQAGVVGRGWGDALRNPTLTVLPETVFGYMGVLAFLCIFTFIFYRVSISIMPWLRWARRKLVSDSITRWPSVRVDIYVFLRLNNDKIIWTYQEKRITSFGSGICSTLTRRIDPFHWRHPSWESQSSLTQDLKLEAELLWMSGAHHSSLCTCLYVDCTCVRIYIYVVWIFLVQNMYVWLCVCIYI